MKKTIKIMACVMILCTKNLLHAYSAVVINPIADLVAEPMAHLKKRSQGTHSYDHLPMCGGSYNPFEACPRTHQLRANEIVEVLEERGADIKVRISSCYYTCPRTGKPQSTYWMHKKDVIRQSELRCCAQQSRVPEKIDYTCKEIPPCITLAQPWYDHRTQTLFSAGTRFKAQRPGKKRHRIFVFDPDKKEYVVSSCPASQCIPTHTASISEKRKRMVKLARSWSANNSGFVPYVWGGCSIATRLNDSFAQELELDLANGKKSTYHQWPSEKHGPKEGIDCSNLIVLAAQSVGIPYFCKNSYTVEQALSLLKHNQDIEVGDIMWTRGHVMIVADLKKNTLIEARHYAHGYGKVHEIPLAEQFKGIHTYDMLRTQYEQQKPVERIDKEGKIRASMQIKIFKLI